MQKSAIGQYAYYVHYHAYNFAKSNKTLGDTYLSSYARETAVGISDKYKSTWSSEQKKSFANIVSALMNRTDSLDTGYTTSDVKEIQDAITKSLQNGFKQAVDIADFTTGKVVSTGQGGKSYSGARKYLTQAQLARLLEQAIDIQNNINKVRASITAKGTVMPTNLVSFENKLTSYKSTLKKLNNEFGKRVSTKEYHFGQQSTERINVGNPIMEQIIEINTLARELGLLEIILTGAQGELFEKILYAAGNMAHAVGVNEIRETFNDAGYVVNGQLTGAKRATIDWKMDGLPIAAWAKTIMSQNSVGTVNRGDIRYSISNKASQIKTDVVIELPDKSAVSGVGAATNISAKSGDIFGKYPIGLVSNTNLWFLIQDLDVKFLRSYLNIMAEHENKAPKQYVDPLVEASAIQYLNKYRQDAFLATQILVIWKALSGHNFGRYGSTASLLVLNDTRHKKIFLVEINDIIRYITNQKNLCAGVIDTYFDFDKMDINSLILDNKWGNSLHDRMANLLNSAYSKKISASMGGDILNKIPRIVE